MFGHQRIDRSSGGTDAKTVVDNNINDGRQCGGAGRDSRDYEQYWWGNS